MGSNRRVRLFDRLPLSRLIQQRGSDERPFHAPRFNQYQSTIDARSCTRESYPMNSSRGGSTPERFLVSVVDDDESIRESLPDLLQEFGFVSRTFSSGKD